MIVTVINTMAQMMAKRLKLPAQDDSSEIIEYCEIDLMAINGYLASIEYSRICRPYHTDRCRNRCMSPMRWHSSRKLVWRATVLANSKSDKRSIRAVHTKSEEKKKERRKGDSIWMYLTRKSDFSLHSQCVSVDVHIGTWMYTCRKSDSSLNSLAFCLSNTLTFFRLVCHLDAVEHIQLLANIPILCSMPKGSFVFFF